MQKTMIIFGAEGPQSTRRGEEHALAVATPLDAILQLEKRTQIERVILTGTYASNVELAEFLREFYPEILVARAV